MFKEMLRVKHFREIIKDLSDDAFFEINISDGPVNQRSTSYDIIFKKEVEFDICDGSSRVRLNIPFKL